MANAWGNSWGTSSAWGASWGASPVARPAGGGKKRRGPRPKHYWEVEDKLVPVVPEVLEAATGRTLPQPVNRVAEESLKLGELEALSEKIAAEAKQKLDEMVRRRKKRRMIAALLAAIADE